MPRVHHKWPAVAGRCSECGKKVGSLNTHYRHNHQEACLVRFSSNPNLKSWVTRDRSDGLFHCPRCVFAHNVPRKLQEHTKQCVNLSLLRIRLPAIGTQVSKDDDEDIQITGVSTRADIDDVEMDTVAIKLEEDMSPELEAELDCEWEEDEIVRDYIGAELSSDTNMEDRDDGLNRTRQHVSQQDTEEAPTEGSADPASLELQYPEDFVPPQIPECRASSYLPEQRSSSGELILEQEKLVPADREQHPSSPTSSHGESVSVPPGNPALDTHSTNRDAIQDTLPTQNLDGSSSRFGSLSSDPYSRDMSAQQQPTPPPSATPSVASFSTQQELVLKYKRPPTPSAPSFSSILGATAPVATSHSISSSSRSSSHLHISISPDVNASSVEPPSCSPAVLAFFNGLSVSNPPLHLAKVFVDLGFVTDELLDVLSQTPEGWSEVGKLVREHGNYAQWVVIMNGLKARAAGLRATDVW
ncbi:hypothetical protein AcW1_001039 [Taiwanofungus camphoratus]|nr:hypothetical protein AcW2_000456 [Antrodia cinnamomea]KAI0964154.1 hypothetical protein AcW1_001039 [Antrodia cinnamomea]